MKTPTDKRTRLCLSRKEGDSTELLIAFNGGFMPLGAVKVSEIKGNRVWLAFEMRGDVRIIRNECQGDKELVRA